MCVEGLFNSSQLYDFVVLYIVGFLCCVVYLLFLSFFLFLVGFFFFFFLPRLCLLCFKYY